MWSISLIPQSMKKKGDMLFVEVCCLLFGISAEADCGCVKENVVAQSEI